MSYGSCSTSGYFERLRTIVTKLYLREFQENFDKCDKGLDKCLENPKRRKKLSKFDKKTVIFENNT